MGIMKRIFTWWEGATLVSGWHIRGRGAKVGEDHLGNVYYQEKKGRRRWVIYNGPNDAARIPPEWYSWIHHQIDGHPDESLPPAPKFLKPATGNLTGTQHAYRPPGALERGGQRAAASGDYEAWTPGEE